VSDPQDSITNYIPIDILIETPDFLKNENNRKTLPIKVDFSSITKDLQEESANATENPNRPSIAKFSHAFKDNISIKTFFEKWMKDVSLSEEVRLNYLQSMLPIKEVHLDEEKPRFVIPVNLLDDFKIGHLSRSVEGYFNRENMPRNIVVELPKKLDHYPWWCKKRFKEDCVILKERYPNLDIEVTVVYKYW